MPFTKLPQRVRALVLVTTLAALWVTVQSWQSPSPEAWGPLLFLVLCGAVSGACKIDLDVRLGRIYLTLGFIVTAFTLLLLGTSAAILEALAGTLAGHIFSPRHPHRPVDVRRAVSGKSLYNCANAVLATALMGGVYHALGGRFGQVEVQQVALPVLAGALCYYLANTGGVALVIGWSQGVAPVEVFRTQFAGAWPGFLAGACLSAVLLGLLNSWATILLLVPPGYLIHTFYRLQDDKVRQAEKHVRQLHELNEAVISGLALAIDAKDRGTHKHTSRVREYAVGLARALRVPDDEVQALRIAALLHDIGKIGIPESILCKPGKLSVTEFEILKSHVDIGVAIIERIPFPWPVVDIVRAHHERWDGLGYPNRRWAEEIPIGARILTLVDVYDALTSDRPYRRAVTREQAVQVLRASSGTQFDPDAVEAFVCLLPALEADIQRLEREEPEDTDSVLRRLADRAAALEALHAGDDDDSSLLGLGAVLAEPDDLASLAARLGERLAPAVPFTSCALFLPARDGELLLATYAGGMWGPLFDRLEMRVGEGASGFVAASGEAVINVPASLDLARRVRPGDNLELNSTLSVPLVWADRVVGVLTVYHSAYNFYQPRHRERLARAADQVAQALQRMRLGVPVAPPVHSRLAPR